MEQEKRNKYILFWYLKNKTTYNSFKISNINILLFLQLNWKEHAGNFILKMDETWNVLYFLYLKV